MDLTNKLYKVFLIAGSEPLGTAGMQADIKSISACGGYAAGAITCIVDEDTIKVKSIQTIPVEMVVSQTYSFLEDVVGHQDGYAILSGVGNGYRGCGEKTVYTDRGRPRDGFFCRRQAVAGRCNPYLQGLSFPYSTIITPNRREADLLLGKSLTKDNMKEYIPELSKWGNCVIVKSIEDGDYLIDVFYNPISKCFKLYKKARIQTKNVNGTGDTFASSIATYLARGYDMNTAVDKAENFIYNAILYGSNVKFGSGYGPVYPFYENLSNFLKEDIQYAAAIQVEQYIL